MIAFLEKRPLLTIIGVVVVLLFPYLNILEVSIMEARNFISAREMLTDRNWILTTMNGEPRYQKPPLPTWLTALSASVFGLKSLWGLRLPAALMVMLLGSIVFTLSRKFTLSKSQSLVNGLIAVTSLYVVLIIFEAPWDIFAHAFMLTGIFFILKILNAEKNVLRNILLAAIFMGCSILSKGPVSIYALFLPFIISYIVVYRKTSSSKMWLQCILSIILGLLIGFSWYAYVRYADPITFARITSSETGNWTSYNVRPIYYYWSFFVQSGLWTIPAFVSLFYPYLKSRVLNLNAYQVTWLWTILAVILLSIIPEKKSRYLMPVLIPLAMNSGFYVDYLIRRFKELKDKREIIPVYFNFGLIGLLFLLFGVFGIISPFIYEDLSWWLIPISLLLVLLAVVLLRDLIKKNIKTVFALTICSLVVGLHTLGQMQQTTSFWEDSNMEPSKEFKVHSFEYFDNVEELPIYSFDMKSPEMIWASGGTLPIIYDDAKIMLPQEDRFYMLVFETELLEVKEAFQGYEVKYLFTLDLNKVSEDSRSHTKRKKAKVFLIEKSD